MLLRFPTNGAVLESQSHMMPQKVPKGSDKSIWCYSKCLHHGHTDQHNAKDTAT